MDPRRHALFWALEEYFDSGVGGRSAPVALKYSFVGEASGLVQEGLQRFT